MTSWRARRCPWNFFFENRMLKTKFLFFQPIIPTGHPWVSTKKFCPIGSAVWSAMRNINTNVLFYYKDGYDICNDNNSDWIINWLIILLFFSLTIRGHFFNGMIYPKGLSKNSTCLTEYINKEVTKTWIWILNKDCSSVLALFVTKLIFFPIHRLFYQEQYKLYIWGS